MINRIILYANIVSINGDIFFVFLIQLMCSNLDLGIETCSYNDMDDYAKYVATTDISHLPHLRIQRLTARRVLVTLYIVLY